MSKFEHDEDYELTGLDEHLEFEYSTDAQADRQEARELGRERPDLAWIGTSRDAVHPNPFYKGPPVPHPDDYSDYEQDV